MLSELARDADDATEAYDHLVHTAQDLVSSLTSEGSLSGSLNPVGWRRWASKEDSIGRLSQAAIYFSQRMVTTLTRGSFHRRITAVAPAWKRQMLRKSTSSLRRKSSVSKLMAKATAKDASGSDAAMAGEWMNGVLMGKILEAADENCVSMGRRFKDSSPLEVRLPHDLTST